MPRGISASALSKRIERELQKRLPEIEKMTEIATGLVNDSIVTHSKNKARERLTRRGAELYAQFYTTNGDNTRIGISNNFPMEGIWDIADIIENKGAKPHPITSRDPANRTLKYFWHPEHIKGTLSTQFGDNKWHTDRVRTWHPGLSAQHIMRDAERFVLKELSGIYYGELVATTVAEIVQNVVGKSGWE